jgi:hypothetical protein
MEGQLVEKNNYYIARTPVDSRECNTPRGGNSAAASSSSRYLSAQ